MITAVLVVMAAGIVTALAVAAHQDGKIPAQAHDMVTEPGDERLSLYRVGSIVLFLGVNVMAIHDVMTRGMHDGVLRDYVVWGSVALSPALVRQAFAQVLPAGPKPAGTGEARP